MNPPGYERLELGRALRRGAAKMLWGLPAPFRTARWLGAGYTLRCALFHDIAEHESPLTAGLGVTMRPDHFEERLRFLRENYRLVDLDQALDSQSEVGGAKPPLLVTFDDAYASVATTAAPLCQAFGVPAVFFVNVGFVDNPGLALDNLVTYVVNTQGLGRLEKVSGRQIRSLRDFFGNYLPSLDLGARERLALDLASGASVDSAAVAREYAPYLSAEQLRSLKDMNFEIGSHTSTHVHCRSLTQDELRREIVGSQRRLQDLTGRPVRAFSFPYGSARDATRTALETLQESGHTSAFLVEARPNTCDTSGYRYSRVSLKSTSDAEAFLDLEVLPRLRAIRDRLSARRSADVD